MRKGDHVRLLSAKLEKSMVSLFQGSTDLPRLVLENMDSSQIQAQPNCSPELAMYLDIADLNFDASANIRVGPESLGQSDSMRLLGYSVDLTMGDENADSHNSDSARSPLERLVSSFRLRILPLAHCKEQTVPNYWSQNQQL